jgi:hypothetical protein
MLNWAILAKVTHPIFARPFGQRQFQSLDEWATDDDGINRKSARPKREQEVPP